MVGKLPGELGSLSKLVDSMYSTTIYRRSAYSLAMSSLEILSASINQFEGRIPATLGRLKRIKVMEFGGNKLSGTIPPSINNITSLEGIDFEVNQLKGSLPLDLGFTFLALRWQSCNLEVLELGGTDSRGHIPSNIGNLQKLQILQVHGNSGLSSYHGQTPMVHCDLKPSNVLLDDELTAHVGDWIEYSMGSEVSTQGDVYSYGILLLEMFTGKRPTDEMFNGDMNLHDFVKTAILERVIEIVDPVLLQEIEEGQTSLKVTVFGSGLISIFGIGVTCSSGRRVEGRTWMMLRSTAFYQEQTSTNSRLGRGYCNYMSNFLAFYN
ncbi:probable LRR receptor-like serine/threonine-protein kinase At3g47570 [Pistacia vera]|uniref:probable LRR receptor-like serine/threonine-protein kinase At3g47570 n=1 Tax=Pistacia vera TaxID=55513 RepID=UPI001262D4B1|nr:probable LRR receptor-like serine/threonine-protein kinase At3g47570 [Pistacia vera]